MRSEILIKRFGAMIFLLTAHVGFCGDLSFTDITFSAGTSGPTAYRKTGGHSAVWADADSDGLPDLFITMLYVDPVSDLFFRNLGGSVFANEGVDRGVDDFDGGSHGAAWADLDNDGDYDHLNGTTYSTYGITNHNNIYANDDNGYFSDATPAVMQSREELTRAILAFDMDGDGDLDIFSVSGYLGSEDPTSERNEVYINHGDFQFSERTSGPLYTCPAGQGATDTDYDGDGDIDLFVANRTSRVNILRNNGMGQFDLVNPDNIGILDRAEDGISTADVDLDGDLDLLLTQDDKAHFHFNDGDGTFTFNRTFTKTDGYMGGFADLDNDGDLDLVFAGDNVVYINDGTGGFSQGPVINVSGVKDPRGIGFADLDNDGDLDFAFAAKKSRNWLVQNNYSGGNRWLKVRLISPQGQAGAFGSKARIYPAGQAGGPLLGLREAKSNQGYLGQDDPVLHFGLGMRDSVDVAVTFLDGSTATRRHIAANQTILIDGADIRVQVRVFLEGTYNAEAGSMADSHSLDLPLTAPYVAAPRTVEVIPNSVVDWVLMTLRMTPEGDPVASRSGFLTPDGLIMDIDGSSVITMTMPPDDYYITVHHRNHLEAMSALPVAFNALSSNVYDFTTGCDQVRGGLGCVEVADGVWAQAAGNADDTDQAILAGDLAVIRAALDAQAEGYHAADVNLDGQVDEADYQLARHNMLDGRYIPVP